MNDKIKCLSHSQAVKNAFFPAKMKMWNSKSRGKLQMAYRSLLAKKSFISQWLNTKTSPTWLCPYLLKMQNFLPIIRAFLLFHSHRSTELFMQATQAETKCMHANKQTLKWKNKLQSFRHLWTNPLFEALGFCFFYTKEEEVGVSQLS